MTRGVIETPWTGGEKYRGYWYYKEWGGGDATSSEKKSGTLQPHTYYAKIYKYNSPRVTILHPRSGSKPVTSHAMYYFGPMVRPRDPWSSNDWNSLVSELYNKVKGGDFNASVATAELGQTLSMIANAATRIYRAYRFARKGQLRNAAIALTGSNKKRLSNKAASKEMANNWLELQYGWLPLLGDVHSGAELLANHLHRPVTRVVRVRKQVSVSERLPGHGYWTYGSATLRHRCQIIAYLKEDLTGYQKLGLTDPFTIAWELLPYSFVLDWFLPIGPWLEAATAARTLKGTFVVTHTIIREAKGLFSGKEYVILGGEPCYALDVEVNRTISTELRAKPPAFKPLAKVASLRHCLNALALLENLRR